MRLGMATYVFLTDDLENLAYTSKSMNICEIMDTKPTFLTIQQCIELQNFRTSQLWKDKGWLPSSSLQEWESIAYWHSIYRASKIQTRKLWKASSGKDPHKARTFPRARNSNQVIRTSNSPLDRHIVSCNVGSITCRPACDGLHRHEVRVQIHRRTDALSDIPVAKPREGSRVSKLRWDVCLFSEIAAGHLLEVIDGIIKSRDCKAA